MNLFVMIPCCRDCPFELYKVHSEIAIVEEGKGNHLTKIHFKKKLKALISVSSNSNSSTLCRAHMSVNNGYQFGNFDVFTIIRFLS